MYPQGCRGKCIIFSNFQVLQAPDDQFEHENPLMSTLDVPHVDFSENLKFGQSSSNVFSELFKYPDFDNDYQNSDHGFMRVNMSNFMKSLNWSIGLKDTSWHYKNRLVDPRSHHDD